VSLLNHVRKHRRHGHLKVEGGDRSLTKEGWERGGRTHIVNRTSLGSHGKMETGLWGRENQENKWFREKRVTEGNGTRRGSGLVAVIPWLETEKLQIQHSASG